MTADICSGAAVAENREDYVYRRAYDLATSGAHIGAASIISALAEEGYPEAHNLLSSKLIHSDLNQVCSKHWSNRRFIG